MIWLEVNHHHLPGSTHRYLLTSSDTTTSISHSELAAPSAPCPTIHHINMLHHNYYSLDHSNLSDWDTAFLTLPSPSTLSTASLLAAIAGRTSFLLPSVARDHWPYPKLLDSSNAVRRHRESWGRGRQEDDEWRRELALLFQAPYPMKASSNASKDEN